jgi:hypothetical protein
LFLIVAQKSYLIVFGSAAYYVSMYCLPPQTLFDMEQDEKKNFMAEFDAEDEEAIR